MKKRVWKRYPLPWAIGLCALCFLLGRIHQQYSLAPSFNGKGQPLHLLRSSRKLAASSTSTDSKDSIKAPQPVLARPQRHTPSNPWDNIKDYYNPANLTLPGQKQFHEILEQSGLYDIRPPEQPAATGNANYSVYPFQILSWFPRVVLFPNFLSAEECAEVIQMGKDRLYQSGVALRAGEKYNHQIRTSQGTFLSSGGKNNTLGKIERRLAEVTMLHWGLGEPFNLLRYDNGQHYDSHYDTFDPKEYGPQASQRIATVLLYMSDVEEGGETIFKLEGKDASLDPGDYRTCDTGLKYRPREGDALLFHAVDPSGVIEKRALHGGCPVIKGTKWVMTKWIRNKGAY